MIKELISEVKPESVRMILDAGGCKGSVIARLSKIEKLSFLVRGKRQRNLVKQWENASKSEYKEYTDPGKDNIHRDKKEWEGTNVLEYIEETHKFIK